MPPRRQVSSLNIDVQSPISKAFFNIQIQLLWHQNPFKPARTPWRIPP